MAGSCFPTSQIDDCRIGKFYCQRRILCFSGVQSNLKRIFYETDQNGMIACGRFTFDMEMLTRLLWLFYDFQMSIGDALLLRSALLLNKMFISPSYDFVFQSIILLLFAANIPQGIFKCILLENPGAAVRQIWPTGVFVCILLLWTAELWIVT